MNDNAEIPERMRAAFVTELGAAEKIRIGMLDVPRPGPTDVLVRAQAVAVNPVDTFVRSGAYPTPTPFPFVVGRDLAGTVVTLGSGVTGFAVGDRVWCNSLGHGGRQGAAAEYAVVPGERLYPLPDGVDTDTVVAVAHPATTAQLALFAHGDLRAGETVHIAGGAGHVGAAATVLASRAGARVVTSASAADRDYCHLLGAETVLDYRDPDLAAHLHATAPAGIDVHLDTSGKHDLNLAVDVLASRGRIVLMSGITTMPEMPVGRLYTRDGSMIGFAISNARVPELAAAAARINQLLAGGALAPRGVETLELEAAADAHSRVESGRTRGTRLVLHP